MVLRTLCSINSEKMFDTLSNCGVTELKKTDEGKAAICVYVINQMSRGTSYSHRCLNFISVPHHMSTTTPHGA